MLRLPRLLVALSEKHNAEKFGCMYAYRFLRNSEIGRKLFCGVLNSALYAAALCLIGMCCPVWATAMLPFIS